LASCRTRPVRRFCPTGRFAQPGEATKTRSSVRIIDEKPADAHESVPPQMSKRVTLSPG
jgi:hypothetical protein